MKMDGFIKAAKKGIVVVEFTKLSTNEKRVMPCTLNRELSGNAVPEDINIDETSDNIAVWAIDKNAWRSFRVETVTDWYRKTQ